MRTVVRAVSRRFSTRSLLSVAGAAALLLSTASLSAQQPRRTIGVGAGGGSFDASGTGTTTVVTTSVRTTVGPRWLEAGISASWLPMREQFTAKTTHAAFAEAEVIGRIPTRLSPYIGGAAGRQFFLTNRASRSTANQAFSGIGGIDYALSGQYTAGVEGRVRYWGDSAQNADGSFILTIRRRF